MEVRTITVDGIEYTIDGIYYRTRGSLNQTLTDQLTPRCEPSVRYYLTSFEGQSYWIKEIDFPKRHYLRHTSNALEARKEFERGSLSQFVHTYDLYSVQAVRYIGQQDNKVVQEYCDGYKPLKSCDIDKTEKGYIKKAISGWLDKLSISNYDMSVNNVLKRANSIVMIDFADSPDKPITKCKKLLEKI